MPSRARYNLRYPRATHSEPHIAGHGHYSIHIHSEEVDQNTCLWKEEYENLTPFLRLIMPNMPKRIKKTKKTNMPTISKYQTSFETAVEASIYSILWNRACKAAKMMLRLSRSIPCQPYITENDWAMGPEFWSFFGAWASVNELICWLLGLVTSHAIQLISRTSLEA